jgi:hypothetical protein
MSSELSVTYVSGRAYDQVDAISAQKKLLQTEKILSNLMSVGKNMCPDVNAFDYYKQHSKSFAKKCKLLDEAYDRFKDKASSHISELKKIVSEHIKDLESLNITVKKP